MKNLHIIISGDVVGVGFRSWVRERARQLGITGWVKNREDDTVEIIAEGKEEALETLLTACHKGPDVAWVEHVDASWHPATRGFPNFEVVY